MTSALHGKQTYYEGIHSIVAFVYANEAARLAATGFESADLWKVAVQQDDETFWVLTATTPTWQQLGAAGGPGTGDGDSGATYVVLSTTASLSRERVLTVSGSSGLLLTDAGPNGSATLTINDNLVATVSGTTFTGIVSASAGLSGSLQRVGPNLPYLLSQGGITLTTQSNGQIIISGSVNTDTLPVAGTGINVSGATVSINDNVVATVSGTTFTGPVLVTQAGLTGSLTGTLRGVFSGSLTRLENGISYLVAHGGISITTQSNGQIVISGSAGQGGSNPTAGTGILVNGTTVSINDNVVATISGSTFTGVVSASAGLSGSLQRVAPNLPYLLSQGGITITTQSNGQIVISGSLNTLPVAGTGIITNNNTVSINDNVVATVSGTTFTGVVSASAGLSGSLQRVGPNLPYLLSQGGVSITTQSNGQIVISGSVNTDTLPTAGTGILVNGSTVSVNDNVVATITGSTFTGLLSASQASLTGSFTGSFKGALSGSLTRLDNGLPYLLSQGGITLTTQSNGQIIISGAVGGGGVNPIAGNGILVDGSTIAIDNSVVATVSGTTFTGVVSASAGLSGSLQQVGPNLPYLLSQGGITITTQSNGQIVISGSANTDTLPTAGTGISVAGSTVSINNNVVATVSGTTFTGPVIVTQAGLTGSLTGTLRGVFSGTLSRNEAGQSLFISNNALSITTQSNGQILFSASNGLFPFAGTGILVNGTVVSINDNVVATVSGTRFTGVVSASAGISGSLQQVSQGIAYLHAVGGVSITTQSNGQLIVSSSQFVAPVAGTGIRVSNTTISINDNVVATVSGTTFTGVVSASAGLSGSLQQIGPGLPYLLSQGGIAITTQSNGQIVISGSVNTDTLPAAGTGITVSGATVSINNNVVATVSGTTFTGVVSASAGLSGSLQRIGPNLPYLLSQGGITITTQSNGQIVISGSANTDTLPSAGTGISVAGSTVSINNNVVATVSGTTFTGIVSASAGLSGSLQQVGPGLPYLLSQGGITITTQSNGQIIISGSSAGATGPQGPSGSSGFVDGGSRLKTTSSVSITSTNTYADENGTNVYFFVSGTIGLTGSTARKSLFGGDVYTSGTIVSSRSVVFASEINFGNKGQASPSFDFSIGQKFRATLTGSLTASFVNPMGATNILLVLFQDSTGGRTISWPASVKWPASGTVPTLTTQPNGIDIVSFYFDGSSTYYGVASTQFV